MCTYRTYIFTGCLISVNKYVYLQIIYNLPLAIAQTNKKIEDLWLSLCPPCHIWILCVVYRNSIFVVSIWKYFTTKYQHIHKKIPYKLSAIRPQTVDYAFTFTYTVYCKTWTYWHARMTLVWKTECQLCHSIPQAVTSIGVHFSTVLVIFVAVSLFIICQFDIF